MRILGYLGIWAFAILSMSCKGSDSSDGPTKTTAANGTVIAENGLCTQSMIDIHNDVLYKAETYARYGYESDRLNLKSACEKYSTTIGTSSCRAQKKLTGVEDTMSASSLSTYCQVPEASTTPKSVNPPATPSYPADPAYPSYARTCSADVQSELRSFETLLNKFAASSSTETTYALEKSCTNLKVKMGWDSCEYNGRLVQYSVKYQDACEKIEQLANLYRAEGKLLEPKNDPSLSDLTDGSQTISIVAIQPNTFNQLLAEDRYVYVRAGTAFRSATEAASKNEVWCRVDLANGFIFTANKELKLKVTESNKNDSAQTVLISEDDLVSFVCAHQKKGTAIEPLTVAQFKATIGKWFRVKAVKAGSKK